MYIPVLIADGFILIGYAFKKRANVTIICKLILHAMVDIQFDNISLALITKNK
jgi:hypothetical protein